MDFDCSEFAIGDADCPVGCAELDAVAWCEDSLFLAEDFDAEQPDRIVLDTPPVRRRHRKQVGLAIDSLNSSVTAFGNRELFASASEANHVAFFVFVGDRALGAREAAIHQDGLFGSERGYMTSGDQFGANGSVQFAALVVCRADDENALS